MIFALHSFWGEDREQCNRSDTTDDSDNLDWIRGIFHCRMEFIN